jgi:type II secretory pathway pseudopilin PulG
MERSKHTSGITLIEIVTALALAGILATVAGVQLAEYVGHLRARSAARKAADAFQMARSEAIRTGRNHIVFFGPPGATDPAGTAITDGSGQWVPMLILDDGPPDSANCRIDAGEATEPIRTVPDVTWGVSQATARAPDDPGAAPFVPPQANGATFTDPANNPVNWMLFRPDGIPVAFSYAAGACAEISTTGRGGGALYLTNGKRDYGVVVSPLGGVRVHHWVHDASWSS